MKRTKITYRTIGRDHIIIEKIENVASRIEIVKEFGMKVSEKYFGSYPYYYFNTWTSGDLMIFFFQPQIGTGRGFSFLRYRSGDLVTNEGFNQIITQMKAAGNRLSKIRAQVKAEDDKVRVEEYKAAKLKAAKTKSEAAKTQSEPKEILI